MCFAVRAGFVIFEFTYDLDLLVTYFFFLSSLPSEQTTSDETNKLSHYTYLRTSNMPSLLGCRSLAVTPIDRRQVYQNAQLAAWPTRQFLVPKPPVEDDAPKQPKKPPPICFFSSTKGRLEWIGDHWQSTARMVNGKYYQWIDNRWQRWPRKMLGEEGHQSGTSTPAGSSASSTDLDARCEQVVLQFQNEAARRSRLLSEFDEEKKEVSSLSQELVMTGSDSRGFYSCRSNAGGLFRR